MPHVKTDEERRLDAKDWAVYAEQNHRAQREVGERAAAGKRALANLRHLNATKRRARERFVCYCPHRPNGCRLVVAYAWTAPSNSPLAGTETLLLVANKRKAQRAAFTDYALGGERLDPDQWLPVACAHGTGRFPNGIPGQILNAAYTPLSGRHARRITDLLGMYAVEWVAATSML